MRPWRVSEIVFGFEEGCLLATVVVPVVAAVAAGAVHVKPAAGGTVKSTVACLLCPHNMQNLLPEAMPSDFPHLAQNGTTAFDAASAGAGWGVGKGAEVEGAAG